MASVLEEVTLNWTDLTGAKTGATALGSNKFYRAQIMGDFSVVFTYGRVGQSGQVQKVQGKNLADAQKQLKKKIDSKIHEKGCRNLPLNEAQKATNREKSKVRARVEHIFGFIENSMGGSRLRSIGKTRAKAIIGLMNLTYNMFRALQITKFNGITASI